MEDEKPLPFPTPIVDMVFPEKHTNTVDFDLLIGTHTKNEDTKKLLGDITERRDKMMREQHQASMGNPAEIADAIEATNNYISIFKGFIEQPGESASKLKFVASYDWTQMFGKWDVISVADSNYDVASALIRLSQVHVQAAQATVEEIKEEYSDEKLKRGMVLLLTACGIVDHTLATFIPLASTAATEKLPSAIHDINATCLDLWRNLLLSDAESFILARAISKGNKPELVAAIARDAHDFAEKARLLTSQLTKRDSRITGYATYKSEALEGIAHYHNGLAWISKEGYGEAIACLKKATQLLGSAEKHFADVMPSLQKFYQDSLFGRMLNDSKKKLEETTRENDFIFHKHSVATVPELPPPKNLVHPVPYECPPISSRWTAEVFGHFPEDIVAGLTAENTKKSFTWKVLHGAL